MRASAGRGARWIRRLVVVTSLLGLTAAPSLVAAPAAVAAGTVVSLTFDDGYTFHTWVSTQLLNHGMHGSFYMPSGFIDAMDGSAMTWAEAKVLADAGQDVGGHTRDHIDLTSTAYTYDYKYTETCGDRDEFIQYGLDPVTFAYPYGLNNSAAQSLVQACGYAAARTTAGLGYARSPYAETIPPVNKYAIRALSDLADPHKKIAHPTAADLETAVSAVISHGGGWLPMLFHGVCIPSWSNYSACLALASSVESSEFTKFLDWLQTQPVSVKSIGEVISPGGVLPSRVSVDSVSALVNGLQVKGTAGQRAADGSAITVKVYRGAYATGTPVLTGSATSSLGQWSTLVPTPAQGVYTFVATQSNSYGGVGYSNQLHVDTATLKVNHAPVATDDAYSTTTAAAAVVPAPGVLGNDTDADGTALTAVKVTDPAHGTVSLEPNGGLTYTPAAGYVGTDTFTYRANDGTLDSNVATVTLTVTAVNHAPVATDDSYSTAEGVAKVVAAAGVLGNDTDSDGNALTAVKVSEPAHGLVALVANGGFTYSPTPGYVGTDSFTYKANDGTLDSNVATVTITLTPSPAVDHAPVATDDSYGTLRGTQAVVPAPGVLGNDTDADGTALTAVQVSNPAHGTVSLSSDGAFTYMPAAGYVGADSFTYKANDGTLDSNTATVTIAVRYPTAITLTASTSTVRYGGTATMRTTLKRGTVALGNRTVALQRCALTLTGSRQVCGAWKTIRTTQTNSYGAASYVAHPSWNARYRWAFAGTSRLAPSRSRVATVYVRPAIVARASALSVVHNHRITLSARVRPNHTGRQVILQRYVRGVGWVKVATVALTTVDATTSTGTVRVMLSRVGTFSYRFVMPADARHAAGVSNTVVVRAT